MFFGGLLLSKKLGFWGYNSEWDYQQKKINPTHYDISNSLGIFFPRENMGTLGIGGPKKISNPMNTPYIGLVFIRYILLPQKKKSTEKPP